MPSMDIVLPPPLAGREEVRIYHRSFSESFAEAASLEALLSRDEIARAGEYVFRRDQSRFIIGRGLTRRILASHLGISPKEIVFAYNSYGKPSLHHDTCSEPLRFNVSHSGDAYLLAVTKNLEPGVDIEKIRPIPEMDAIISRDASAQERSEYASLQGSGRVAGFFKWWTRKEAAIKAAGTGAALELSSLDTGISQHTQAAFQAVTISGSPGWVTSLSLLPGYAAALALMEPSGQGSHTGDHR